MYLNGAAGNISTRFTRKKQDYSEVIRCAKRMAVSVVEKLTSPLERVQAEDISTKWFTTRLRTKKPPSPNEYSKVKSELEHLLREYISRSDHAMARKIKSALLGLDIAV